MPKLKHPEKILSTVVGIRLTAEENERLDALLARLAVLPRHRLCRAALLRGLAEIERNPKLVLEPVRPPAPEKRRASSAAVAKRKAAGK